MNIFKVESGENKGIDLKKGSVSIDAYYHEKYNEMRRHRDYQLNTANWCTVILLAIIAGFVSIKNNDLPYFNLCDLLNLFILKLFVVLFIITIVVLGSIIVAYSAKRYDHLRKWMSAKVEPKINGEKYKPEPVTVQIQTVIIIILVLLGLLASSIVVNL